MYDYKGMFVDRLEMKYQNIRGQSVNLVIR